MMSVDEQLALLTRGAVDVISREELAEKLKKYKDAMAENSQEKNKKLQEKIRK